MMVAGEDPTYVARRLVRFAAEDVGMADPQGLVQAMTAWQAFERLGSPEGELCLVQALIYLATAPKSNAIYKAQKQAMVLAQQTGSHTPPKIILERPDQTDEGRGLWHGVSIRSRYTPRIFRAKLFP